VEHLEDRCLLSSVIIKQTGDTLRISQNGGNLSIDDSGNPSSPLTVTFNEKKTFTSSPLITDIEINAKGAKNFVFYSLDGTGSRTLFVHVHFFQGKTKSSSAKNFFESDLGSVNHLASGANYGFVVFGGSAPKNVIEFSSHTSIDAGATLSESVFAGSGPVTVESNYTGALNGALNFNLNGGPANDTIAVTIHALHNSKGVIGSFPGLPFATVNGGGGNNVLYFNAPILRDRSPNVTSLSGVNITGEANLLLGGLGSDACFYTLVPGPMTVDLNCDPLVGDILPS
jgi:hypothetical protein